MLRFFVPEYTNSASERAEAINIQIKDFLHMEAFSDLLKILEVDIDSLGAIYNGRLKENGAAPRMDKSAPRPCPPEPWMLCSGREAIRTPAGCFRNALRKQPVVFCLYFRRFPD